MNWIIEKIMMEFINRFILGTSCYSCFSLQQSGFLQNTSKYSLKNPDFRRFPFIWLLAFEWKENFRLMLPGERAPSVPCYGFFLWVIPQQLPQGRAAHPGVCSSSINMARTYSSPDSKGGRRHSAPKASTQPWEGTSFAQYHLDSAATHHYVTRGTGKLLPEEEILSLGSFGSMRLCHLLARWPG